MQLTPPQRRNLAATIKSHMKNQGLSFTAFGERSGINANTISRLTKPSEFDQVQIGTRTKLEKALGHKWADLVGEAQDRAASRGNGHSVIGATTPGTPVRRMLVIELCGSRINIPAGVEVSILDSSTLKVR